MKVYGFTIVDSDPDMYSGATESRTRVFFDKELRDKEAYEAYVEEFSAFDFEDEIDCAYNSLISEEKFLEEMKHCSYICIQYYDKHVQIELFECEIE